MWESVPRAPCSSRATREAASLEVCLPSGASVTPAHSPLSGILQMTTSSMLVEWYVSTYQRCWPLTSRILSGMCTVYHYEISPHFSGNGRQPLHQSCMLMEIQ